MTAEHIRAARGFLRWSAKELSQRAGIHVSIVERLERDNGKVRGRSLTTRTSHIEDEAMHAHSRRSLMWRLAHRPGSLMANAVDLLSPSRRALYRIQRTFEGSGVFVRVAPLPISSHYPVPPPHSTGFDILVCRLENGSVHMGST